MPVHGDYFKFAFENLAFCPTYKGVFSLHDGDETIYIGKADEADGLRGRLQAHRRGDLGPCTQQATAYRRELHTDPSARQRALLEEHRRIYGRLPRCNELNG